MRNGIRFSAAQRRKNKARGVSRAYEEK